MIRKLLLTSFLLLKVSLVTAQTQAIQMVFVGDVMLDKMPGKYIKRGNDPFINFASLFKQSDIVIGNLECVVGNTGKAEDKPFVLRANTRVLPVIKKYFTAVSLANNHTGDFGPKGLSNMIELLDHKGIRYFGAGKNIRSAHEPILFESNGMRIAVLGYDIFLPRSFESLDDRPGTAWGEADYIQSDITRAKEFHKADIVIIYPHWGWEGEKTASVDQVLLAHLMIDTGADLVIGGHPHVTQNIEIYRGKPIFYSLGNFVFDGFDTEDTTVGWVLKLIISPNAEITWQIYKAKLDKDGIPRNMGLVQHSFGKTPKFPNR